VNERIKGQAIAPRIRKVGDANARVASGFALTPEEQSFFGGALLLGLGFVFDFDFDVLYLKA
jgi:hypothetical protein